jgi:hypothetical protein
MTEIDFQSQSDVAETLFIPLYIRSPEPRLGATQAVRYLPFFAKAAGIFHYRLGERWHCGTMNIQ